MLLSEIVVQSVSRNQPDFRDSNKNEAFVDLLEGKEIRPSVYYLI